MFSLQRLSYGAGPEGAKQCPKRRALRGASRNAIPQPSFRAALDPCLLTLLKSLVATLVGVGIGLAATWLAVERDVRFGLVATGPWTSWPRSAYRDADPYTRASLARTGEIPLSLGEGLSFVARQDETGAALDPRCDYVVGGAIPPARYWTLTVMSPKGALIPNASERYGLTSAEIVRASNGAFEIAVSSRARPGNWLPAPPDASYALALRLYDTPASSSATALAASQMPHLRRGACS